MTPPEQVSPRQAARFPLWLIAAIAYCVATSLLWGDPFKVLYGWRHPFNAATWLPLAVTALVGLALAYFLSGKVDPLFRRSAPAAWPVLKPTVITVLVVVWVWALPVIWLTYAQSDAVKRFDPDYVRLRPISRSILQAPHAQFDAEHGVAVKACKPYIWSFREMGFVAIKDGLAVNVVPIEWRKKCGMPLSVNDLR